MRIAPSLATATYACLELPAQWTLPLNRSDGKPWGTLSRLGSPARASMDRLRDLHGCPADHDPAAHSQLASGNSISDSLPGRGGGAELLHEAKLTSTGTLVSGGT